MNESYHDMNQRSFSWENHDRIFRDVHIPYERTREEVWAALEKDVAGKFKARLVPFRAYQIAASIAAVLILLLGTITVMRYYSVSVSAPQGIHQAHPLPGGSEVLLNAGSELTYYPLWWTVKRLVRLEGEAYFEVEKGKRFQVVSGNGKTEVLGTSFTIYSRPDEYRVACFTGSVRVTSCTGQEAVLGPEYHATIDDEGYIIISKVKQLKTKVSWIDGMFSFTSRPLRLVLDEVERQYDVTISLNTDIEFSYTGYFSKDRSIEEVLELVCKPFGLHFERKSVKSFEIYPNY